MKAYFLLFKNSKRIYQIFTIILVAVTVFLLGRIFYSTYIGVNYPNELREAANIGYINNLVKGRNLFSAESLSIYAESYENIYLYPFVYDYLVAGIVWLTQGDAVSICYAVTIVSMLGSSFVAASMVKRHATTGVGPALAFLLLIFCQWRFGYVGAVPDSFGCFLTLLALLIATSNKIKYKPIICAFLIIVLFYTKQYFITIAASLFVFFWCYSKKEAGKLFLWCCILLAVSAIAVTYTMPYYWIYTVVFLKGDSVHISTNQFRYVLEQFIYILTIFGPLLLAIAFGWIRKIRRSGFHFKTGGNDLRDLFTIQVIIQALSLIYFGTNDGSFLTYFLQMWCPSIVILGCIYIESDFLPTVHVSDNDKLRYVMPVAYFAIIAYTIYTGCTRLPFHILNGNDLIEWEEAYDIVDKYRQIGEVYYCPVLAYKGMESGDFVKNAGHEYATEDRYNLLLADQSGKENIPFYEDTLAIYEKNLRYADEMREKAKTHRLSLITIVDENDPIFSTEFLKQNGYEIVESITLQTGNMDYNTNFWAYQHIN